MVSVHLAFSLPLPMRQTQTNKTQVVIEHFLTKSFGLSVTLFLFIKLPQRWRGLSYSTVLTQGEQKLKSILRDKFPKAVAVQVQDVSGM